MKVFVKHTLKQLQHLHSENAIEKILTGLVKFIMRWMLIIIELLLVSFFQIN